MTTTIDAPGRIIENVANQTKDQLEGLVRIGQDQTRKQFEQTFSLAKEQMETVSSQVAKSIEEISSFSKANAEALIESGNILARGAEDFGKEVTEFARTSFENSIAAGKRLMTAGSLREAIDLQNDYTRSLFDSFFAEAAKMQDLSLKLLNDVSAPLNARINAAAETLSRPIANA